MTELLVAREWLKKTYSKHGRYVQAGLRACLMFFTCFSINMNIGYMKFLNSPLFLILAAGIAALLPLSVMPILICAFIMGNLFAASVEMGTLFAGICVIMFLVYFSFKPGNSLVMTLTILLGMISFNGPIAIIVGLIFSPIGLIPMSFGLLINQFVLFVDSNYTQLVSKNSTLMFAKKIMLPITGLMGDETFWINVVILVFTALIVYVIRRLSVKHSWMIAIITGGFIHLILVLATNFAFNLDTNYVIAVINLVLEIITGLILKFFFYMVDYSREEVVQFEDDDNYYYVKMVPKIKVTVPDVVILKINDKQMKKIQEKKNQVKISGTEGEQDSEKVTNEISESLSNAMIEQKK